MDVISPWYLISRRLRVRGNVVYEGNVQKQARTVAEECWTHEKFHCMHYFQNLGVITSVLLSFFFFGKVHTIVFQSHWVKWVHYYEWTSCSLLTYYFVPKFKSRAYLRKRILTLFIQSQTSSHNNLSQKRYSENIQEKWFP